MKTFPAGKTPISVSTGTNIIIPGTESGCAGVKATGYLLNLRVPAEFEIAIGIEIGSGNVRLTPIFDSDFDPDFGPQLS